MNEISIIDKELEDDIFNLTIKENLFNQIEKEIEYIDETIEYKALLESNNNKLNTTKNINISLTDYKTCKSIYEQLSKKDKIAMNAYGTSTVFSDGNEVVKRYCCTIDNEPVGFMEYSRYHDGYTYISIAILSKYRGKPYNIANRFITLAKMENTNIRYVANKKNLASQKFIEKYPEFKLADTTRDCYVYEYQKSITNDIYTKKKENIYND